MNRFRFPMTGLVFAAMFAAPCHAAEGAASPPAAGPVGAIAGGKLLFNLRPRVEWVDQAGKADNAFAITNRTLLGWETAAWRGVSVTAQIIDVARLDDSFNEGPAASVRYPIVADPDNTDINQLFVDYAGVPSTRIRFGRQSLKLDNVRFVGNVEFRQVMQVFTGLWIENRTVPGLELNYGHFDRVKNIFAQQRQTDLDLFRAAWTWQPDNVLVGFAYLQDQAVTGQATGFADNGNRIVGLRANGAWPAGAWKILYTAEYASQDAYGGGDRRIDARYQRLGGGIGRGKGFVRLDYDRLGSNGGQYAFQTPLGTNHLFQGWADQFLTTPAQGIRDLYVTVAAQWREWQFQAEAHDFRSDFADIRYGSELDLGVARAFSRQLTAKVEVARFREGDILPGTGRKPDTTRIWVTAVFQW